LIELILIAKTNAARLWCLNVVENQGLIKAHSAYLKSNEYANRSDQAYDIDNIN
jgi:hypothetical protein